MQIVQAYDFLYDQWNFIFLERVPNCTKIGIIAYKIEHEWCIDVAISVLLVREQKVYDNSYVVVKLEIAKQCFET